MSHVEFNELKKKIRAVVASFNRKMQNERFSRKFAIQSRASLILYENPQISINELSKKIAAKDKMLSYRDIDFALQRYKKLDFEERKKLIIEAIKNIEDLYHAIREGNVSVSISLTEAIRQIVFQREETTPDIRVRFMLIHLLNLFKTESDYQLSVEIDRLFNKSFRKMGDVYSRKLFVQLFDVLTKSAGVGKKFSLSEATFTLPDIHSAEVSSETEHSDLYEEYLKIRDAFVVLSKQLDEMRDNYLAYQETAAKKAKRDFFVLLNSDEHNRILDTLALSDNLITNLYNEGWKPDRQEVESIIFSVRSLLSSFQSLGIEQMYKIGEVLKISLDDVKNFEYLGTEFRENEEKTVIVQSPGWKFENQMISRPKVKEIVGESHETS